MRAVVRLSLAALTVLAGAIAVLLTGWLPIRLNGVRLGAWPTRWMARVTLRLLGISFDPPDIDLFRQHQGFVLCNHQSFVDVMLLSSLLPVRYLAKAEVRRYPLLGWIGWAVGTVFVERGDRHSRQRARAHLLRIRRYPPVVIFPEGGIGAEPGLQPFRHGAFEIAIQSKTPLLPCVIIYEPAALIHWGDESLPAALWRLARNAGPANARLIVLPTLRPTAADNPAQLALSLHEAMQRVLAGAAPG